MLQLLVVWPNSLDLLNIEEQISNLLFLFFIYLFGCDQDYEAESAFPLDV